MSFLTLNGWTVPVMRGGTQKTEEIGGRQRAFDGTLLTDRRAIKRAWEFLSTTKTETDADALRAVILGLGDSWRFDGDLYSSKGYSPAGSDVATYHAAVAADTRTVKGGSKYGADSITVEEGRVNLLAADARDMEAAAPSGWQVVNTSAITSNASYYWQGTKSLRVVCSGAGSVDGAKVAIAGAYTTGERYYGSLYILCASASKTFSLYLRDVDNAANGTAVDVAPTANVWTRVTCEIMLGGNTANIELYIVEKAAADNTTFYIDGGQIERYDAYRGATSWVDGTRAAGLLTYSGLPFSSWVDLTVMFWVWMADSEPVDRRTAVNLHPGNIFSIGQYDGFAPEIYAENCRQDGLSVQTWYHVCWTYKHNLDTGETYRQRLYIDGVEQASATTQLPAISAGTALHVGHINGAYYGNGLHIDDLVLIPACMPAAWVAAAYALAQAYPITSILMAGDAVADTSVSVKGSLTGEDYNPSSDSGTWKSNMRKIGFALDEV